MQEDINPAKKVLMVASQNIVTDLSDGGKKGSNRNWKLLCDIYGRENVWLIEFDKTTRNDKIRQDIGGHIISVRPFNSVVDRVCCVPRGSFFENPQCDSLVVDYVNRLKVDLVFVDRTLFGNLVQKVKKDTCAEIWLFSHNLEKDYIANKFRRSNLLAKLMSHIAHSSEGKAVELCDRLFTLTERDSRSYQELYKKKADYIVPTTFEDRFDESKVINGDENDSMQPAKELLFIGSCFNANYDGIKWFVENVMESLPDFKLKIVGKGFENKKEELERVNVKVIGTVDDLEPFYYADNMMVMPIFYGAGQKVKTAEAMMYGKVIFATDEALEGYDVESVRDIYRCNTAESFVESILDVSDHGMSGFSENVRMQFLTKYSYEAVLNTLINEGV